MSRSLPEKINLDPQAKQESQTEAAPLCDQGFNSAPKSGDVIPQPV